MSGFEPYPPAGFDAFWTETEAAAASSPLDFTRSPGDEVDLIEFRGISGETLFGWICAAELGSPAFLWVPPYGRESLLPNEYGTRTGMTSMSFNFFGHEAMHQEKYTPSRGYFAEGVDSAMTSVFREMYQNASIAVRVLAAQPEVDRVASMGMSQGAGISIWLGAWNPMVRAVCADMPFLGAIANTLSGKVHRYPVKELLDHAAGDDTALDQVIETLSFFDTMNQAAHCHVPTHVSLGLRDPAARPEQVRAIFAALPGRKELVEYDWGHDWHAEMIERNRAWLLEAM